MTNTWSTSRDVKTPRPFPNRMYLKTLWCSSSKLTESNWEALMATPAWSFDTAVLAFDWNQFLLLLKSCSIKAYSCTWTYGNIIFSPWIESQPLGNIIDWWTRKILIWARQTVDRLRQNALVPLHKKVTDLKMSLPCSSYIPLSIIHKSWGNAYKQSPTSAEPDTFHSNNTVSGYSLGNSSHWVNENNTHL